MPLVHLDGPEANQIHYLPIRVTYSHPSHRQSLLANSLQDIPVFVHGSVDSSVGAPGQLKGSVALKDVLRIICRASPEIIPSTQIKDGSVYVRSNPIPKRNGSSSTRTSIGAVARPILSARYTCRPKEPWSDRSVPALTSSMTSPLSRSRYGAGSGRNHQCTTSSPLTPRSHATRQATSPMMALDKDDNDVMSPSSAAGLAEAKATRRLRSGSEYPLASVANPRSNAWMGKGTISGILSENDQGKTLIKCRISKTDEFNGRSSITGQARLTTGRSAAPRQNAHVDLDANDGLAALAMEEGEIEGSDGEMGDLSKRGDGRRGWGVNVEIKLRTLGHPISLDQTSRIRSSVFGEINQSTTKCRPSRRRQLLAATQKSQAEQDARQQRARQEVGKVSRLTDQMDGVVRRLARKTPGQMAEIMAKRENDGTEGLVHSSCGALGMSGLGLEDSDLVTGDQDNQVVEPPTVMAKHVGAQRYPASLMASSSLKRKSLAIPHDQIPYHRRGPNLSLPDRKRRRVGPKSRSETPMADLGGGGGCVVARTKVKEESPGPQSLKPRHTLSAATNPVRSCANCRTQQSVRWLRKRDEKDGSQVVCDACGLYFNKTKKMMPSEFWGQDPASWCKPEPSSPELGSSRGSIANASFRTVSNPKDPAFISEPAMPPARSLRNVRSTIKHGLARTLSDIAERESLRLGKAHGDASSSSSSTSSAVVVKVEQDKENEHATAATLPSQHDYKHLEDIFQYISQHALVADHQDLGESLVGYAEGSLPLYPSRDQPSDAVHGRGHIVDHQIVMHGDAEINLPILPLSDDSSGRESANKLSPARSAESLYDHHQSHSTHEQQWLQLTDLASLFSTEQQDTAGSDDDGLMVLHADTAFASPSSLSAAAAMSNDHHSGGSSVASQEPPMMMGQSQHLMSTTNTILDDTDAFAFFDSSVLDTSLAAAAATTDSAAHHEPSPFDFSQLPPSSPPQEIDLPHSRMLMSSPEDSANDQTPF